MINIGLLTKQVIGTLEQGSKQLVGDGIAPHGGGWLSGQPNVSAFVPYGVVLFSGASLPDPSLRYAEQIRSWETSWRLSSYGGAREQCDWVAALLRGALADCIGEVFGSYKISMAQWRSLGGMTRNDSIDPPMWSVSDTFILRCDA